MSRRWSRLLSARMLSSRSSTFSGDDSRRCRSSQFSNTSVSLIFSLHSYAAVDFREAQHAERLISLAPRMGDFEPTYKYSKPPVKVVKPSRTPLQRDPYRVAIVGLPADVAEEEVRRVVELSVGASVIGEITVAKKRHSPKDRSASR